MEDQHHLLVHSHELPVLTVDTSHTVADALGATTAYLHVLYRTGHLSRTLQQQFWTHRYTQPVGFKGFQEHCMKRVTWIPFPFGQHSLIFYVHSPTEPGQPFAIFRGKWRPVFETRNDRSILSLPPFLCSSYEFQCVRVVEPNIQWMTWLIKSLYFPSFVCHSSSLSITPCTIVAHFM